MANQLLLFGALFDDLNTTIRELELLREATKNATAAIQQTQNVSEMAQAMKEVNGVAGCGGVVQNGNENGCGGNGTMCVSADVLWCFLMAALVFGVCVGLWIAGEDGKGRAQRPEAEGAGEEGTEAGK